MRVKHSKTKGIIKLSIIGCTTIIVGILFHLVSIPDSSALTYQEDVDVQFSFNPVLNLNLSTSNLTIANLAPGSMADSNIITISASSNAADGYTLYATVGSSSYNYTDLRMSSSNTTNVFANLASSKASLSNFDNNTWGYSYSTDSGTTWRSGDVDNNPSTGYNGLPIYSNTGVKLAKTSAPTSNSDIKFKIGAKSSANQTAGNYTNTVNFTSIANIVTTSYTLNYVDSSNEATNMPSATTGVTTNGTFNLSTTTPTRTNYIFKGWCTTNNSSDPSTCSGIIIQPGKLYSIGSSTTSFTGSVYAVWRDATIYMQDLTTGFIAALLPNVGDTTTVYDKRDEKAYKIGKLADNNYWMLENLALDLTVVSLDTLKGNTNASDQTLTYLKNGGGTGPYTSTAVSYAGSVDTYIAPQIAVSGVCGDAFCVNSPSNGNWSSVSITPATINGITSVAQGKIGIYYNFCAASAGSYCYAEYSAIGNASYDVCPAGWRLPVGGNNGEFSVLYASYSNDATNFQTALITPFSGFFDSGKAYYQGNYGFFWSSTYADVNNMSSLKIRTSVVVPSNGDNRKNGRSIRCIKTP